MFDFNFFYSNRIITNLNNNFITYTIHTTTTTTTQK